jgi:uncharacterized protein YkwD
MRQNHFTQMLVGMLVLAAGLSSCSSSLEFPSGATSSLPPDNAPSSTVSQNRNSDDFATLEQSVYQQVNQYRQSRNLPPLKLDPRISEQARLHSQEMASGRVPFSHEGFDGRVKAIAKSIRYRRAGENVAYNQGFSNPGQQAVEGWIKSPGHRENMEGNFDLTGMGVAKNARGEYYFTQIFIKGG